MKKFLLCYALLHSTVSHAMLSDIHDELYHTFINDKIIEHISYKETTQLKNILLHLDHDERTLSLAHGWKIHAENARKMHADRIREDYSFQSKAFIRLLVSRNILQFFSWYELFGPENTCPVSQEVDDWAPAYYFFAGCLLYMAAETTYYDISYPNFEKIISQWEQKKLKKSTNCTII